MIINECRPRPSKGVDFLDPQLVFLMGIGITLSSKIQVYSSGIHVYQYVSRHKHIIFPSDIFVERIFESL